MANNTISARIQTRIQNKHDIEANWLRASFIPMQGEIICYDVEVDAEGNILALPEGRTEPFTYERFKIGDGINKLNDLPFSTDTLQPIVDSTLNTTDKTVVGAINEINENVSAHNTDESAHIDIREYIEANYNESIIGLSVEGQTVTYIKGDGSSHTFTTQDTNTTYSLGTDTTTGLTKLYATVGSAEDGTMTQKAIKTELDKKVGVSINDAQNMLIFTI